MSDRRNCRYAKCRRPLPVTARADAEYCDDLCRSRAKNERRRQGGATTRVDRPETGAGSRGGNVRSLTQADSLHAAHKAEWKGKVAQRIAETLIVTGGFHADDLQPLEVPEAHSSIIGTQTASFVNRKLMVKVGERPCQHKAANSRKGGIYRITAKGREDLAGSSAEGRGQAGFPKAGQPQTTASVASGESGPIPPGSDAGVPTPQGEGGAPTAVPMNASVAPPTLFEDAA